MVISDWDEAYRNTPPWDTGRPQPVFEALVKGGEIRPGRVLDAGCGTGENALMLAKNGCRVTGIDLVPRAIDVARSKAAERHLGADFIVGNALELDRYFDAGTFDTAIDSGLFHVLSDEERPAYIQQICRVLGQGGRYFMLCFSDKEPGTEGPRRVSKREIEAAFSPHFLIKYIRDTAFDSRLSGKGKNAYLLSATKA
jgi:ubiquinone/menaquinone biosynthesis C-methylase UbiE